MVDSVQGLFPYLQCVADFLNFWHLYPAQFHESHKFLPNDFFNWNFKFSRKNNSTPVSQAYRCTATTSHTLIFHLENEIQDSQDGYRIQITAQGALGICLPLPPQHLGWRLELAHPLLCGFEQGPHAFAATAYALSHLTSLPCWICDEVIPLSPQSQERVTLLLVSLIETMAHWDSSQQLCFVLSWQLKLAVTASFWFYLNLAVYLCLVSRWSPITCAEDWEFIFLWGTGWTKGSRGILRRCSDNQSTHGLGSRKGLRCRKSWCFLGSKDGGSEEVALNPGWTRLHAMSSGFCALVLRLHLWWEGLGWMFQSPPTEPSFSYDLCLISFSFWGLKSRKLS